MKFLVYNIPVPGGSMVERVAVGRGTVWDEQVIKESIQTEKSMLANCSFPG